jgi:hypothetical protein
MPRKSHISVETTFGTYVIQELLGEGGAGRVTKLKDALLEGGIPLGFVSFGAEDDANGQERMAYSASVLPEFADEPCVKEALIKLAAETTHSVADACDLKIAWRN